MFNNIDEATEVLMSRKNQTYGVDGLKSALEALNDPHLDLNVIHIAGTNGKGSTTNYVRSILQSAGFRVGTFTSPHLHKHNDRIRINDKEISDEELLDYINSTYDLWMQYNLSMFEIDMLISALYFKKEKVDYVVYEVGLGGRLDATNVVNPKICAITNIGFDHQAILGDTLAKIAAEKAGIIKKGIPIITSVQNFESLSVILNKSITMDAPFKQICIPHYTHEGKTMEFEFEFETYKLVNQATYQVANASLAIAIIKNLLPTLSHETIQNGLLSTHWAGRFEEILPLVYVDGAHNEMGIKRLVESIKFLPKPITVVFAALKDKSFDSMMDMLESVADQLIVTEFDFYRAASAKELGANHKSLIKSDYKEAIDLGIQNKGPGTLIITGSLYFISEARSYLLEIKDTIK